MGVNTNNGTKAAKVFTIDAVRWSQPPSREALIYYWFPRCLVKRLAISLMSQEPNNNNNSVIKYRHGLVPLGYMPDTSKTLIPLVPEVTR
jgi:hypothetical protein